MTEKIGIIGLGYVGLPLGVALSNHYDTVIGYDINDDRVEELQKGYDSTEEVETEKLKSSSLQFVDSPDDLEECSFFIVTVPTPVDSDRRPDLTPVKGACRTVAQVMKRGSVVVFESTVYPGVTEEICAPLLEKMSGLKCGRDFTVGYSPERINPGDKVRTLETIVKVVGAQDDETLKRMQDVYGTIIQAGLHLAPNIRVAEASKVIENIQRDVNIALMNELALIFNRMDIRTKDVIEAASSKWNFLKFTPGLVGGHCIGVDPYYLSARAQRTGYHPEMILTSRRLNESMGHFIAKETIAMMIKADRPIRKGRIGVLGITFKENVPDLRNSRVPDIIGTLQSFGLKPMVHDPMANKKEVKKRYGIDLVDWEDLDDLDAVIYTVPHRWYDERRTDILKQMNKGGVFMDVKSNFEPDDLPDHLLYWSL